MTNILGLCPYCSKGLTKKEIKDGCDENFGLITAFAVYKCVHCNKIISIGYGRS